MIPLIFIGGVAVVMALVFFYARPGHPVGTHHTDYEPPPEPEKCQRCGGTGEIETPPSQAHGWVDPAHSDLMTCPTCGGSRIQPPF